MFLTSVLPALSGALSKPIVNMSVNATLTLLVMMGVSVSALFNTE